MRSLETSDFTSVQRCIQALVADSTRDRFLAPVQIDERHDPIGPQPSTGPHRCSDKGFLAMGTVDYLALLDWTARQVVRGKGGHTPEDIPPILARVSAQTAGNS